MSLYPQLKPVNLRFERRPGGHRLHAQSNAHGNVCAPTSLPRPHPSLGPLVLTTWLRKLKGVEGRCPANSSVGVSPLHEEDTLLSLLRIMFTIIYVQNDFNILLACRYKGNTIVDVLSKRG
ncbi:unnamed protein product, partial [Vitis vinifera]|uniref:Uncharacterized protein n=1 Tax=Vitis vinifera TaxID=29760 RepID=D7T7Y0_VITVI